MELPIGQSRWYSKGSAGQIYYTYNPVTGTKYLVENPEVIDILKHNLSKNQREKYSMEKICKDRVELYREIMKNKYN